MTAWLLGIAVFLVLSFGSTGLWAWLNYRRSQPYPPEAAEVPDPIDEHFQDLEALYAAPAYERKPSNG